MKKYDYKGIEIWKIQGGFDMIRCKAGVFMYCLTGWSGVWKLYPPADSTIHIKSFETEQMLVDFVVSVNENSSEVTEEIVVIN